MFILLYEERIQTDAVEDTDLIHYINYRELRRATQLQTKLSCPCLYRGDQARHKTEQGACSTPAAVGSSGARLSPYIRPNHHMGSGPGICGLRPQSSRTGWTRRTRSQAQPDPTNQPRRPVRRRTAHRPAADSGAVVAALGMGQSGPDSRAHLRPPGLGRCRRLADSQVYGPDRDGAVKLRSGSGRVCEGSRGAAALAG